MLNQLSPKKCAFTLCQAVLQPHQKLYKRGVCMVHNEFLENFFTCLNIPGVQEYIKRVAEQATKVPKLIVPGKENT